MRISWQTALYPVFLGLLLLLAEATLRQLGSVASWREANHGEYASPYAGRDSWLLVRPPNRRSGYGVPEFDFELATNSLGIRDVEHPIAKAPDEFRIVALGDSFTEGQGAPFEKSWPSQLAAELAPDAEAVGLRITPIVGGVAGSDPFYAALLLERRLLAYDPDLVILALNKSDVVDVVVRGGRERFRADGSVAPGEAPSIEWIFARSHLARAFLMGVLRYDWTLLPPGEARERRARALAAIRELVVSLHERARSEGFALLVVVHPSKPPLPAPGSDIASIVEPLTAQGIAVLDLIEYFRDQVGDEDPEHRYFWRLDRHATAAGYAVFARGIADGIRREGLLARRPGARSGDSSP